MSEHRTQQWWDIWHLGLAQYHASASKDPSTKVGAVIVDSERRPVGSGYNGFARKVDDSPERLNDRELKYKLVVHAERNALLFARGDVRGCTLYTAPFMPCAPCAAMVIQAGITRVVSFENDNPRWQADFELTRQMFREAGVELVLYEPPSLAGAKVA